MNIPFNKGEFIYIILGYIRNFINIRFNENREIWGHGSAQPSSIQAGLRAMPDYPLHETTRAILTPLYLRTGNMADIFFHNTGP